MHLIIFVLIFCFVLFLFKLYHLAVDDYVLIKKNISIENVFNVAFVCSIVALFSARLIFVIFNFSTNFLNPLVFVLFPYFPGLSLVGGLLGSAFFLLIYSRYKKFPTGRIFDFFTIAFLFSLPPGLVGFILLSSRFSQGELVELILFVLLSVLTSLYLYPKASSLEIKDGSLSMLFVIFYSLITLLSNSIDNSGIKNFIANGENFILISLLISGVALIIRQEIAGRINFEK